MTRTDGRTRAIELKLSPTHTARSLEMLSRRLGAFVGPIGSGSPCDEPDLYLIDGHTVSGDAMWKAAHRSPTVSTPRPPVDARFVSADPAWGARLAEVRHEALLHQLRADVIDLNRNSPTPAAPAAPARLRGGRRHKHVDALLGKVEEKIITTMKRQRAPEAEVQKALYDRLYSQHSPGLARIIKDELRITISERSIRRAIDGEYVSRKYAAWARHRSPAAAPSVEIDLGPAYSRQDGEAAVRSATGETVAASIADSARASVLEGSLRETRRAGGACRAAKTAKEQHLEKAGDDYFRAVGLNPADFQAD
jgi:hypothetical protein